MEDRLSPFKILRGVPSFIVTAFFGRCGSFLEVCICSGSEIDPRRRQIWIHFFASGEGKGAITKDKATSPSRFWKYEQSFTPKKDLSLQQLKRV